MNPGKLGGSFEAEKLLKEVACFIMKEMERSSWETLL